LSYNYKKEVGVFLIVPGSVIFKVF